MPSGKRINLNDETHGRHVLTALDALLNPKSSTPPGSGAPFLLLNPHPPEEHDLHLLVRPCSPLTSRRRKASCVGAARTVDAVRAQQDAAHEQSEGGAESQERHPGITGWAGYRASSACYSSARYGSARLHPGSARLVIVTSQQVSSARLAI
jgi:hypothetical protein